MCSITAGGTVLPVVVKSSGGHGQKPLEWVTSLLSRFEDQLPVKAGPLTPQSRLLIEHGQSCLVNVSRHKFSMVVGGLVKMLQSANAMRSCSEQDLYESEVLILDTLDKCLSQITPKEWPMRLDESTNIRLVIQEMSQFLQLPSDSKQAMMLKDRASKVLYSLSIANFPAVFSRISAKLKALGSEANAGDGSSSECYDVQLIKHMHVDKNILIKLLREVCNQRPFRKESHLALSLSVEKAIWNWFDSYPSEFAELQHVPCDELAECCDRLFDQLEEYGTESWKRKASFWPLQMMLLILCPTTLEEIHHFISGAAVISQKNMKKKLYFESVRKTVSSAVAGGGATGNTASKQTQLLTAACVACVKLCKAATYISVSDFLCGWFTMLQSILTDLKALLFNTTRPLFRSTCGMCPTQDLHVMIDVFVALFRLKYDNEIFKVCLNPATNHTSGAPFHLVLVMSLYRVAVQPRLAWWPKIDLIYSRSQELRNVLSDTLNKVNQSASGIGLVSALSSSGHMPLKVTQSLQKMTGRLRERTTSSTFEDQNPALKQLLFWLIRLICTEPSLFLHGRGGSGELEFHNSTSELVNGLVTLMCQANIMPDIAQEAMEALLCLHQPENIRLWNPESVLTAMQTFWCISSQLIFSVSQKLLHHQLANYPEVLRWLRQLFMYRNSYLACNQEIANYGSQEQLCKQAAIKLETVCFVYLWSLDNDAVLMGMSLFRSLCEEAEIRYTPDELPQEYFLHTQLANASNLQTVGRAVLQAWEDTYQDWESFTKYLTADVRSRTEERFHMIHNLHRNLTQRKSIRSDHELEDIVNIWANTTGFLCALGGLCQHNLSSPNVQAAQISSPNLSGSGSFVTVDQHRGRSSISQPIPHITPCQEQYCPVTMFLSRLLSLLLLPADALDPQIIRHVKELLSSELNPALYPCLFDQITIRTDKLFDSRGTVSLQQSNTEFVQHIVYIMKNLLTENTTKDLDIIDREIEILASICIEPIMLSICRYLRYWEFSNLNLNVKSKVCHLIEIVMQRRDHLLFRNEIRFRNKLVEYVAEWLTDNHMSNGGASIETTDTAIYIRDLDVSCVSALSSLLSRLPLQPEESERDVMDARSQLFQKYFTLFMNLLNNYGCPTKGQLTGSGMVHSNIFMVREDTGSMVDSESGSIKGGCTPEHSVSFPSGLSMHASQTVVNASAVPPSAVIMTNRARHQQTEHQLEKLRSTTVKAMSNLLAANIDSGLVHAIGLGYHLDVRVRGAFLEVLTQILHEGGEFETLNETVLADRYQELCKLITMITDDGQLPMTMTLANVVHIQQLDDLARILVTLFDANHLLYELTWKMFSKEVELAEAPTTLFRGNTLASKIMGFCFRIFGSSYLHTLLKDFVAKLVEAPLTRSYEVDPARLEQGDDLNENIQNVLVIVTKVFDTIVRSHERFPQQLRSICHCLYQVVNGRFPNNGLSSVETIVFLRFINPAIVSPFEHGLTDSPPPPKAKRGLMLVSKILQAIANQATFLREPSLAPFNVFIQSRMDHARQYTTYITLGSQSSTETTRNTVPCVGGSHSITFVSEAQMISLHKLLWQYQEDMSHSLCSTPAYSTLSRRMATLLAQIGPPAHKPAQTSVLSSIELDNRKFEEIMDASKIRDRDEFKNIQEQNMFYQGGGRSKNGHPVYYYIARRFKKGDVNGDALIYHVLLTLKPHQTKHQPFELVLDLTHASTENRFKTETLQRWFQAMSEQVLENLVSCFIINSNSFVRDYVAFHQRILGPIKGHRKLMFLDNMQEVNAFIDHDQLKLPSATLALDENVKTFQNAIKLWHKDISCNIKVGPTALQINFCERQRILGYPVLLNDVYYASEIEEVCLVDDNNITLTIMNESSPLSLIHTKCEDIVNAIVSIRNRYESSQPEQSNIHAKIRAKDVPGTLLNMALLNLGSSEPRLRTCAYNLLCALAQSFDFKLGDSLLETEGILIPPNNTSFICAISEQLGNNEPHLTLELLNECIQGFRQSNEEMKHLCLEYISPWLNNLPRFLKQSDDQKRLKVVGVIEKLIALTIEETEMYPLIQSKIWGNVGRVVELLDLVIDGFIRRSSAGGFGSHQAELMADTTVALAASNVQAVASIVVNRLISVLDKSGSNADAKLEENAHWDDIAILARYLLFLSFNNCLDVISHLPYLFHLISLLMHTGPLCLRASIHGLTLNIIHSLCTCTHPTFSAKTKRTLRLALTEFSLTKFYRLFGVDCLTGKTAAAAVFKQPVGARMSFSGTDYGRLDKCAPVADSIISLTATPNVQDWTAESPCEQLHLTDLQTVTDSLIEIIDACQHDLMSTNRELRVEWTRIARSYAVRYNPALQPRALVVYSCLAKSAVDGDCHQLLMLIVQAIKRREESQIISALLMALTRLHPLLPSTSLVHKLLFWLSLIVFQLEDAQLYEHALGLLEGVLETLETFGTFDYHKMDKVLMDVRRPLEWEFKALDQQVGLSFVHHFHFALVGYLLKGLRHSGQAVRNKTARVLNIALNITARPTKRSRFEVASDSLPYLLALLPVSEDVRRRCQLHAETARALSMSAGSTETLTNKPISNTKLGHHATLSGTMHKDDSNSSLHSPESNAFAPNESGDCALDKIKPKFKPSLTLELLNSAGTQPSPPSTSGSMGVQMPRVSDVRPFLTNDWNETRSSLQKMSETYLEKSETPQDPDTSKNKSLSAARRHQLVAQRSHSLPLPVGDTLYPVTSQPMHVQTQTSPSNKTKTSIRHEREIRPSGHWGSDDEPITPKISVISEQGPQVVEFFGGDRENEDWSYVKADAQMRRKERKVGSRHERASILENNVLLDPDILAGQDMQALALTVLATLVRNSNDEKETKILFEYLAEASFLFPKVFPVVHCLLDQRITQVLQLSHDPTLLRAVLHIVQNMVPGRGFDMGMTSSSIDSVDSASQQQRQHITFLQTYGFGGLWRYAGPFLSKSASQQAMTAEVCACMERLVGTLGDLPPLTPPPPSPRLPNSPVFNEFPHIHGE